MKTETAYQSAREIYASYGVDADKAIKKLNEIHISLHCWQGDDVTGFETRNQPLSGGIVATGNYLGRACNGDELREDYEKAFSLIPGKHRANLHAIYLETEGKSVDRDEIETCHFQRWIDWAKGLDIGLDFNPTFFSHDKFDGFTLSHPEKSIRDFWINHGKRCRSVAADMGKALGKTCINNFWMPDGMKDMPANKLGFRRTMRESLDEIFNLNYPDHLTKDALESKLFGIGAECYTVASHEFCLGYALNNELIPTYDTGHFHPTESIADKVSSTLLFTDNILLHVSRGVRWDSDHVVIQNDELIDIMREIKRCDAFNRIYIGLDYFDASINRICAWVTGARAALKAILFALLEPTDKLVEYEQEKNYTMRLGFGEEIKALPWQAVWDYYCEQQGVPIGDRWLGEILDYESTTLRGRKG